MKRLILAVLAGLITNVVLATAMDHLFHTTGVYPPYGQPFRETGPVMLAFTYRALFVILGTYLAARLAKDRAKQAVLTLGTIGSVLWLIGAITMWEYAPAWYNISGVVLGIPFALLGGILAEVRSKQLA